MEEKRRGNKKRIAIIIAIFIIVLVCSAPVIQRRVFCYDTEIAHPDITQLAAIVYNRENSTKRLTVEEIGWLMDGAKKEDTPTRWLNHFYDPINNAGLYFGKHYLSAKEWAVNPQAQTKFSLGDESWQRAKDYYRKGDKEEAFKALGHVLHLVADMSVPAHTREDIHVSPPDSYEDYVKNHWPEIKTKINPKVVEVSNLNEAFDKLASYSNNNFYSDDTIEIAKFKITEIKNSKIIYDNKHYPWLIFLSTSNSFLYASKNISDWTNKERQEKTLKFPMILEDYSLHLVPKAVGYDAGVIKLFLAETEKDEKENLPKNKVGLLGWGDRVLSFGITAGEKALNYVTDKFKSDDTVYTQNPGVISSVDSPVAPTVVVQEEPVVSQKKQTSAPKQEVVVVKKVSPPVVQLEITPEEPVVEPDAPPAAPPVIQVSYQGGGGSGGSSATPTQDDQDEIGGESDQPEVGDNPPPAEPPAIVTSLLDPPVPDEEFSKIIYTTSTDMVITGTCSSNTEKVLGYATQSVGENRDFKQDTDCVSSTWSYAVNLEPGENYWYFSASSSVSTSTLSSAVEIVRDNDPPPVPVLQISTSPDGNVTVDLQGKDALGPQTFYTVALATSTPDVWQNIVEWSTSTSFSLQIEPEEIYYFRAQAKDGLDNTSAWSEPEDNKIVVYVPRSQEVVINEIAWAGTSSETTQDEWLELYNNTDQDIDLKNWKITFDDKEIKPLSVPTTTIHARSFYLLERTDDRTVSDIPANYIFSLDGGIKNTGARVKLLDPAGKIIDEVNCSKGWFAGDDLVYKTMERINPSKSGNDPANWQTNKGPRPSGTIDGGGQGTPLYGSPRQPNFGHIVLKAIQQDTERVLTAEDNPYILRFGYVIPAGKVLKINSGVVIKAIYNASLFDVYGKLEVNGSVDNPVVFTSGRDTSFSDDKLNEIFGSWSDNTAAPADWQGIWLHPGSETSIVGLNMRYGGYKFRPPDGDPWWANNIEQAVRVDKATATIDNSSFVQNGKNTLYLQYSTTTITNTQIDSTDLALESRDSSLVLDNLVFSNTTNSMGPTAIHDRWPTAGTISFQNNKFDGLTLNSVTAKGDVTMNKDLKWYLLSPKVASGSRLTIEAGTKIWMPKYGFMNVDGQLQANGTADDPVFFDSFSPNESWGYIHLNNSDSSFSNVNFVRGNLAYLNDVLQMGTNGVVIADNSKINMENCSFTSTNPYKNILSVRNSDTTIKNTVIGFENAPTVETTGLSVTGGKVKLEGVRFKNLTYGIYGNGLPLPQLDADALDIISSFESVPQPLFPLLPWGI